jgi:hypothetical protein
MTTPTVKDAIGRFAQLSVIAENCAAHRRPVPPQVLQEMQQIEGWGRARLSPEQMQAAVAHVEQAKVHWRAEYQQRQGEQSEQRVQQKMGNLMQRLTGSMMNRPEGLTVEQLRAVAAGKKIETQAVQLTQDQRDAHFRDASRAMDPNGIGWGEKEYERRMDALADASPAQFERLAQGYRVAPEALRHAANEWNGHRVEYGVMRRRSEGDALIQRPEQDRDPSDSEVRRASVVNSYLERAADDVQRDTYRGGTAAARELNEDVPDYLLNESSSDGELTRRADVARAMDSYEGAEA